MTQNAFPNVLYTFTIKLAKKYLIEMGAIDFIQSTILRMDLLSSSPSFRVRKQPSYETIFGGIFSFLLMIGFTYVLAIQLQNMFDKLEITYTSGLSDNVSSENSITQLQLAVSIDGVDLSMNTKKFMYFLDQKTREVINGTSKFVRKPILLTPCRSDNWKNVGNNF